MPKLSLFVYIFCIFIFGCSSKGVLLYENETPIFDMERFFNGTTYGWGLVLNRNNKVVKRFQVQIEGVFSKDGKKGKLVEDFIWSDGKKETREWVIERSSQNVWVGNSDGVIGLAHGIVSGNALNWRYRYKLMLENSVFEELEVNFKDWMYLINENVLINHAVFSKLGFELGTVIITFKRVDSSAVLEVNE